MERPTILIADDDFDILELLRFLLESEGYDVITAGNGYEALGAALLKKPDLVVLDVMMPGENGYLVSRALRARADGESEGTRVPVVLLTARDLSDDPERERAFFEFSGADQVIYKPFDSSDVVARINEMIGALLKTTTRRLFPCLRWTEVSLDPSDASVAA